MWGDPFFQLKSRPYERGPMLLTSKQCFGVEALEHVDGSRVAWAVHSIASQFHAA
jgi:hypothetical protein